MGRGQGIVVDDVIGPVLGATSAEVNGSRLLDYAPGGASSGATAIIARTEAGSGGEIELQVAAPAEDGQLTWARLWGSNTDTSEAQFVQISATALYRFEVTRTGMTARVQLVG